MFVLFAHSFFMEFDDKQRVVQEPYPPLGTLIAAACARREGFRVGLFDAMLAKNTEDFERVLAAEPYTAVVFFEDNFNWLSKMCLNRMRAACMEMIAFAKSRKLLVIVAGSDPSDYPQLFLENGADYVIKGEAEFRLLEILSHHEKGASDQAQGPGIHVLAADGVQGSPPKRGEKNLSVFPKPAWDLVDMAAYRNIWRRRHGFFSLNMVTTRGCPYRCNWCAKPIHGRRYDLRDPLESAAEMAEIKKNYHPDHIWFADDIFGLKPSWLEQFADEVVRLNAEIPYKIQARADLIKAATVTALVRSGCRTVWMGVESGSQKVLDAMDKDLEVTQIATAAALLKEAGIEVCFFLQFGYPGETAEDIYKTWQLVSETRPDHIGISVAYPLPGTVFFQKVQHQIRQRDHWEHSHDMIPMHETTFPPDVYPQLYKYFHQRFRRLKQLPRPGLRGLLDHLREWRVRRRLRGFQIEGIPFP